MAARVPARLTRREGRTFAFTVGGALLVMAAVAWWRGHELVAPAMATIGTALLLAGLIVPTHLGPVQRAWMRLAHAISRVTTPIAMGAMYFLVLTPAGLARRALTKSSLVHEATDTGFWKPRPEGRRRTGSMERQF